MVPWVPRTGLRNVLFNCKRVLYPRTTRHDRSRNQLLPTIKYTLLGLSLFLLVHALVAPSYTKPPAHYGQLAARCRNGHGENGCANEHNEKVFISITLYDPAGQLVGGEWGSMLLELIHLLGPENVFLSMYENDVSPQGVAAFDEFRQLLPCRNYLVADASVSLQGFPTVRMPDGTEAIKRTVYLAELRNRALRPLETFNETQLGTSRFDKVLFLNDVFFQPIDAAQLLFSTNRGDGQQADYLVACAQDYEDDPLTMYDSYALRDADGFSVGEQIFPYFTTAGRGLSRSAILAESDAVPVKACWNGMVAMQAEYVQNGSSLLSQPSSGEVLSYTIDPDAPRNVTMPARFRAEPDPFLDASECCLFIADVSQAAVSSGADELGVYINPYVRVAYYASVMRTLPWAKPWERLLFWPHWALTTVKRLPTPNPSRTIEQGQHFVEEVWRQESGESGRWEMVDRVGRAGLFCGIRGMQVLTSEERSGTTNWRDTEVPTGASGEGSFSLFVRPLRASLKRLHSVMQQENT